MSAAETQLASFVAKFDAPSQTLIWGLRAALRKRLPGCAELVWDNYNLLVIGYSPTERPRDYIVSIAAAANGIGLSFNNGAELDDPQGVLQGSGKVNRYIRLPSVAALAEEQVVRMIERACEHNATPRPWNGGGKLIIRSISAKQRPRRRQA